MSKGALRWPSAPLRSAAVRFFPRRTVTRSVGIASSLLERIAQMDLGIQPYAHVNGVSTSSAIVVRSLTENKCDGTSQLYASAAVRIARTVQELRTFAGASSQAPDGLPMPSLSKLATGAAAAPFVAAGGMFIFSTVRFAIDLDRLGSCCCVVSSCLRTDLS